MPIEREFLMMRLELPPIFLCTNKQEFDKNMLKWGFESLNWLDDEAGACCHTFNHPDFGLMFVVSMRMKAPDHIDNIGVACLIVHEATHVWQRICEFAGEDSPGAETEAYTIQSISEALMRQYVNRKWRKSRAGWVLRETSSRSKEK